MSYSVTQERIQQAYSLFMKTPSRMIPSLALTVDEALQNCGHQLVCQQRIDELPQIADILALRRFLHLI